MQTWSRSFASPVTLIADGTSQGYPSAGTHGNPAITPATPETTGDKAIAGVLTATGCIFLGLGACFVLSGVQSRSY